MVAAKHRRLNRQKVEATYAAVELPWVSIFDFLSSPLILKTTLQMSLLLGREEKRKKNEKEMVHI